MGIFGYAEERSREENTEPNLGPAAPRMLDDDNQHHLRKKGLASAVHESGLALPQ